MKKHSSSQSHDVPVQSLRSFLKASFITAASIYLPIAHAAPQYPFADATHGLSGANAEWVRHAIRIMWRDRQMAGITPLIKLTVPFDPNITIYLKNEAKSQTGSLKHRVAWALIMDALVNGKIGPNSRLFEATSGNTAIGEAYYARLLGLPFTAVMRPGISEGKLRAIQAFGGKAEILKPGESPNDFIDQVIKNDPSAYNINQFANTERALDYFKGAPSASMNMANEIYLQLQGSEHPCPAWFVAGAGSGGTATSIARYLSKWADYGASCPARLAVVDPEDSALYNWYQTGDTTVTVAKGSRIEGIGSRGPVRFGSTFSLLREGVSKMIKVPDADSVAAMHLVSSLVGQDVGPSTGTNFCGALLLADDMHRRGQSGAIVAIICDDGARYRENYYNPDWIRSQGLEYGPQLQRLTSYWKTGRST